MPATTVQKMIGPTIIRTSDEGVAERLHRGAGLETGGRRPRR
jgi:hypothetical protein